MITINMRKYLMRIHTTKRAKKAAGYIKGRVAHYMKLNADNVKISNALNDGLMKGNAKRMKPLKLLVQVNGSNATVMPFSVASASKDAKPANAAKASEKPSADAGSSKAASSKAAAQPFSKEKPASADGKQVKKASAPAPSSGKKEKGQND